MSNVEKFDEITEKLLSYLEATFPVPANIGLPSLRLKISKRPTVDPVTETETDAGEPLTEDEKYFEPTVAWLIDAGYIRAQQGKIAGYHSFVLTEKGLAMRGIKPKSLTNK
ncbi:hypothetical protein ACF8MH_06095 [Pseudomonas sp. YQ_13]|uniref:hypothetical protein n=1 Tax=Pseudomonas sp. YQ_13 TaxID=3367235 RepID=UPI00370CA09C